VLCDRPTCSATRPKPPLSAHPWVEDEEDRHSRLPVTDPTAAAVESKQDTTGTKTANNSNIKDRNPLKKSGKGTEGRANDRNPRRVNREGASSDIDDNPPRKHGKRTIGKANNYDFLQSSDIIPGYGQFGGCS